MQTDKQVAAERRALANAVRQRYRAIAPPQVVAAEDRLKEIEAAIISDAPSLDVDGDVSWGLTVVLERVSVADLKRWFLEVGAALRPWVHEPCADDPSLGRLVVYSRYTFLHEHTARSVMKLLETQIHAVMGSTADLDFRLHCFVDPCTVGTCLQLSTATILPRSLAVGGSVLDAGDGQPFPPFVFEVAGQNECLSDMRSKLTRWMDGTSVQVALGIKIFLRDARYVLILHVRGQPTQEVQFGRNKGLHYGAVVSFPAGLLYHGSALPDAWVGREHKELQLELLVLREIIAYNPNNPRY
ncbi:hypothetical protein SDRG_14906 [Saprolegnia diclina VS20]|uniref:Uncharacterized protein n=1 Tax=Saprolegnia diclina (strain VS20) TaxID=1156394 RepID=T0Q1M3_SAPDV|nr:hypothetical protein SDRG_14906 [Saprolegnia diclina VS20]EQC27285.1 hypothetical protein SDRG_14906 [Saprolegnia diclina VS20]|eukprot:XP_008619288.1 hypothetical protein SDRG_14906 [Saprolegnia diclina VS20]